MDDARQQLIEQLKVANNVLVTVSRDPSVDQLASCIGLTLLLNKQGKHAAAVFSGQVPSTLEFLEPEETIEKNTDSLRDFIIALDKSKADKLRYKVEDNVVRIFITPYKTSISQADLEFSEGDFNVDLVIALGVRQQEDLDEAITSHGRILHDATVTSINTAPDAGLGTINWQDPEASSLSELVTELAQSLGDNLLDQQIATALLTGIVSETERFSNDKTSSQTMSASAALMAAGANQQLVASKLEGSTVFSPNQPEGDGAAAEPADAGTLRIDHVEEGEPEGSGPDTPTDIAAATDSPPKTTSDLVSEPILPLPNGPDTVPAGLSPGPKLMTEPPTMGGQLTANSSQEPLEPTGDPLSLPATDSPQLLERKPGDPYYPPSPGPDVPAPTPAPPGLSDPAAVPAPPFTASPLAPAPTGVTSVPTTPASTWPTAPPDAMASNAALAPVLSDDDNDRTLSELEKSLDSPHAAAENLDTARDEVDRALAAAPTDGALADKPIEGLSAQPLGGPLHDAAAPTAAPQPPQTPDPSAPPPVPPPIPFQFGNSPPPQ